MVITVRETKLKPGYKQTEVGIVPIDWELMPLELISAFITKGATPTTYGFSWANGGILFLRSECVSEKGLDLSQSMFITPDAHAALKRGEVRSGDILITITGVNFGRVIHLSNDFGIANTNQHIARIRIVDTNVAPAYVFYFLSQPIMRKYYGSIITGQAYPLISLKQVRDTRIPLPAARVEQQAIATALSDVDALLTSLDKLIAKKRDIKQATMQQLLTGKRRLLVWGKGLQPGYKQTEIGMIPEDWEISSIEEIADVTTGDKDTQDKTETGLYPFFVRSQIVERINSYSYNGEAVLTAGDGVGVGKVFHYIDGKFDFHQRVYMIYNFRGFDGFFFYLYFSNTFCKEVAKYSAKNSVDSVRRDMVTKMKVPCPPLFEQQAIATVLSDMDAEIAALEQKRDKTRALKQGMMQELLTGKTRLL